MSLKPPIIVAAFVVTTALSFNQLRADNNHPQQGLLESLQEHRHCLDRDPEVDPGAARRWFGSLSEADAAMARSPFENRMRQLEVTPGPDPE